MEYRNKSTRSTTVMLLYNDHFIWSYTYFYPRRCVVVHIYCFKISIPEHTVSLVPDYTCSGYINNIHNTSYPIDRYPTFLLGYLICNRELVKIPSESISTSHSNYVLYPLYIIFRSHKLFG